jgi:rhodanese-related sulfurtransferase
MDPQRVQGTTTPIVDARRHRHGKQIRGSVHYDPKKLQNVDPLVLPLPHDGPIAVYAEDDERAEAVAALLRAAGYDGAAILDGGLDAWEERGYPLEDASEEQPVPGDESAGTRLL